MTQKKNKGDMQPGHTGRADTFSIEKGDEVCRRIAMGRTLRKVCDDEDMPNYTTVWRWGNSHPAFRNQLMRARADSMFAWADDLIDISEDASAEYRLRIPLDDPRVERRENEDVNGVPHAVFRLDNKHINRASLQIKTKQWLMERIASAEFGLKQYFDITQSYYDSSDQEIIEGIRVAAVKAGITAEEIVEWLSATEKH